MVSKRFIVKRLLLLVPVVFGVATLVFAIQQLAPGDPASIIAGRRASAAQKAAVREEYGLNDPVLVQYGRFLFESIQLDFGESFKDGRPVRDIILDKLPVTLELAIYGQILGIVLGIPLGILSAIKQDSLADHLARVGALTGISIPIYWSGPLLILFFSVTWEVFPPSGRLDTAIFLDESWKLFGKQLPLTGMVTLDTFILNTGAYVDTILNEGISAAPPIMEQYKAFGSAVMHMVLPAATIGVYSMALISRMTRSSMLEVTKQDYMRTARAKGQGAKITIMKHGLRNALIPVVTIIGIQFGTLLGGAVLTETVFSIGGIGTLLVEAINDTDYPVVQGTVLLFAVLFTLVNLFVDVTYSYLDPRIDQ